MVSGVGFSLSDGEEMGLGNLSGAISGKRFDFSDSTLTSSRGEFQGRSFGGGLDLGGSRNFPGVGLGINGVLG